MHVQLADDVVHVVAHRVDADVQVGGDLLGGQAIAKAAQHLGLAACQRFAGRGAGAQQPQHAAEYDRREGGLAPRHSTDAVDQIVQALFLQQVAVATGLDGTRHRPIVAPCAEDQHLGVGRHLEDLRDERGGVIAVGQAQIQQHHMHVVRRQVHPRFGACVGDTDHHERAGAVERIAQRPGHHVVIVDDQHSDQGFAQRGGYYARAHPRPGSVLSSGVRSATPRAWVMAGESVGNRRVSRG